ncbi:hypothetical protein OAL15_01205 [Flavobacteriales bacterium]|nr:hypothetical protein [Flavobacteriales bacterium]
MRRLNQLLFLFALSAILNSCAWTHRTAYHQKYAQTPIIQSPLMVDVDADPTKKVTAFFTHQGNYSEKNLKIGKEKLLYSAMKKHGCDVILQPIFQIDYDGATTEMKVEGVCGKYTNLRKPTLEDITILQELNESLPVYYNEKMDVIWGDK